MTIKEKIETVLLGLTGVTAIILLGVSILRRLGKKDE